MPKFAAAIDRNQPEIVQALRQIGCTVCPLHTVGGGVPDLLVGWQGETFLLEVKDGTKPPSARALTVHQIHWHDQWRGKPVAVVNSVKEALDAIGIPYRGQIS